MNDTNNTNTERIESKEEEKEEICTINDIVNEKNEIDIKLKSLCDNHLQQQQKIMQEFVANSLRLMHEFNNNIYPLHNTLKTLKQKLKNILLNEFISIPCSYLDKIAKKQQQKTWGISPQYNDYNPKNSISQKYINLGINSTDNDDNINISQYLSNTNNITSFQQDIILNFFTKARQEEKEAKQQREKEEQEAKQRTDSATLLISIFPFLSLDEAIIIMQINSDQFEQATDYCINKDCEQISLTINEWKERECIPTNNNNDRSCMDMRVLNRSQTTGENKCVIFKCIDINDDCILIFQAILDRNYIPLDNKTAKLLYISIEDIIEIDNGIKYESFDSIEIAKNENIICIIFQCINEQDFFPIQFSPKCRDLEYILEFDHDSDVCNNSLISVSHRIDGNVLFNGIYDNRNEIGIIGDSINEPIEIKLIPNEGAPDIKQSNDNDNKIYIMYKQQKHENIINEINNLIKDIENNLNLIKSNNNDILSKELLNTLAKDVRKIQELISCFIDEFGNDNDNKFVFVLLL
eukprot:149090_1